MKLLIQTENIEWLVLPSAALNLPLLDRLMLASSPATVAPGILEAFGECPIKELKLHLARAIEELPERERQILAMYYQEELTLAEIGEVIGVCESRVSQLRSLAVSRLRTLLRTSLAMPEARA